MDRRSFLRALAAVPLVGSVPALAAYKRRETFTVDVVGVLGWKPQDIINVERWNREHSGKRCFLDGEDVTNQAVMALPGEHGWVVTQQRNPDYPKVRPWHIDPETGKVTSDPMPPLMLYTTRYGRVEIRPGVRIDVRADDRITPALRDISDKIGQLEITVTP